MRISLAVLLATGFALPCSAQTILKTEPLVLPTHTLPSGASAGDETTAAPV